MNIKKECCVDCCGNVNCEHCHQVQEEKVHCIKDIHCFEGGKMCDCGEKKYGEKPNEDWEKEFWKFWKDMTGEFGEESTWSAINIGKLEDFIRQIIQQEREKIFSNERHNDFAEYIVKAERERILELLPKGKVESHLCRFNDGKQSCECYHQALAQVRRILEVKKDKKVSVIMGIY